jgi:hypothetical protein
VAVFLKTSAVRVLALLVVAATAVVSGPRAAAAENWARYENATFVAYSRAPGKKVLSLLDELETFRAAFMQVGNITVPPGAPKTVVFVPAKTGEFRKLAGSRIVAGFAQNDGLRTLIVMPVFGDREWTRTVVRHEYGHALLRYKDFRYPAWYEEGFAELVSSTALVNSGKSFTVGVPPRRAVMNGPPLVDWDALVSQGLRPETMRDAQRASSAYAQSWLLAHYFTLGNNLKNIPLLQAYFDRLKAGEDPGEAFVAAFGMTAGELWERDLKAYTKRIPGYTFAYRPGAVDRNFVTTPATAGDVDGILRYLELLAAMRDEPQPPPDLPAALDGRWAPLRIGLPCDAYVDFSVSAGADSVAVTPAPDSGIRLPSSGSLRYQAAGSAALLLETPEDGTEPSGLRVRALRPDLICVSPADDAGDEDVPDADVRGCGLVAFRCGARPDA